MPFLTLFVVRSFIRRKCNWYSTKALLFEYAQNDLSNQQLLSACGCMRGMLIENEPSLKKRGSLLFLEWCIIETYAERIAPQNRRLTPSPYRVPLCAAGAPCFPS